MKRNKNKILTKKKKLKKCLVAQKKKNGGTPAKILNFRPGPKIYTLRERFAKIEHLKNPSEGHGAVFRGW